MEHEPSDSDLVARSLDEPTAFTPIFDRHFRAVHTYLHRRAGRDFADELTAETFAVAFELRATCQATGTTLPWLYGIAWTSSPGFLERAEAAVTPATASILHQKVELTLTSKDFGFTVTTGPNEMWIDQTPPHRWRALTSEFLVPRSLSADARSLACADHDKTLELGSSAPRVTLMFTPPDKLSFAPFVLLSPPGDPGYPTKLRKAIASGRAHDEGTTEVDGRTVERIRFDLACGELLCPGRPRYAYVDPETFFPVREEWTATSDIVGPDDNRVRRFDVVVRYLTFEYLPRTAGNVALTNIKAQHPDAVWASSSTLWSPDQRLP